MTRFILLTDTLCDGVIPAEWGEGDRPCLYDTALAAEAERQDSIATWRESEDFDGVAEDDREDHSEDEWVAEVRELPDGTIETTDGQHRWTLEDLRACH